MNRGELLAVMMIKRASASTEAGKLVRAGTGLAINTAKGLVRHGGEFAEGLGAPKLVGQLATAGALGMGTVSAAKGAKDRVDNWRFQHGLYPAQQYY